MSTNDEKNDADLVRYRLGSIAMIHVQPRPGLEAWPIVERVPCGWQSGVHHYPDEDVLDVSPIADSAHPNLTSGRSADGGNGRVSEDAHFEYEATVTEVAPHRVVLDLTEGHEIEAMIRDRDEVMVLSRNAYRALMDSLVLEGDY